jgi:8-oxo-dGTP pyrophosphatase MutT (NUDIX family)
VKHVVVGIISRNNNGKEQYLLISSKRDFGKYTGFYYPPGGHLEKDEDEKAALEREINEELGIQVKLRKKVAETPGDVENQITHWWKCKVDNLELTVDENEIDSIIWFTKKEILNHNKVWPATKRFFEEYISD